MIKVPPGVNCTLTTYVGGTVFLLSWQGSGPVTGRLQYVQRSF